MQTIRAERDLQFCSDKVKSYLRKEFQGYEFIFTGRTETDKIIFSRLDIWHEKKGLQEYLLFVFYRKDYSMQVYKQHEQLK